MADELSLKDALYNILNGLQDEKQWRETGEGLSRIRDIIPNVTESLSRGGIGQAIGTSGDTLDINKTIKSYLPKSLSNFTTAAEFLANPYARALQETAPTTEQVLETVPRITDPYEGYKQHETLGEYIAPSLGYFGGKGVQAIKATKNMPIGASIIGPESKLWKEVVDGTSLEKEAFKASRLEAKGENADEILKKTGMVRGLDNQWRSEISDFWSTVKGDKPFGELYAEKSALNPDVRVKDILDHPELFRHYPELGEVQVKPHGINEPYRGSYDEANKLITLKENLTPEEIRSVMHHELTHGTQGIENWNRGGSVEGMDNWMKAEANARMDAAQKRLEDIDAQIKQRRANGEEYDDLVRESHKALYERTQAWEFGQQDPRELYKLLGGEAEARMVQERLGLTQDQLRQHFPYAESKLGLDINPDKAIVAGYEPGVINNPSLSAELPKSNKDELGFHSSLENAIFGIKQPKGTGDQFLKQLEKTPGVKAEELEVTGLKQYLQDHPTVTKQEVQDFIARNRLELENTILERESENTFSEYQTHGGDIYHDQDYINSVAEDLQYEMINDPDIYHEVQQKLVNEYPELYEGYEHDPGAATRLNLHTEERIRKNAHDQSHQMYYDNPIHHYYDDYGYDIYGNDDVGYSFKGPNGQFLDIGPKNGIYDAGEAEVFLREHLLDEGIIDVGGNGAKYEDYVLPGNYENYREVLATIPENLRGDIRGSKRFLELQRKIQANDVPYGSPEYLEYRDLLDKAKQKEYESGHFDEPNILAHMRVNDRTINGKKTLMVEEIQSDWHQAGRKKGYKTPDYEEKVAELKKDLGYVQDKKRALIKEKEANVDDKEVYEKLFQEIQDLEKEADNIRNKWRDLGDVPDAPFKKNWHEMMIKQALEMAAKGDYDAIAFTTGKQQAARYNLSKQIDALDLIPAKEGDKQFVLQAWKDGRNVVRKAVNEDELADYVGKEVAEKLLAQEPKGLHRPEGVAHGNPNVFQGRELTGLDLETGGKGMKGFYDKIIPDYINKYAKKWGMGMKKANLHEVKNVESFDDFAKWANENKGQGYFSNGKLKEFWEEGDSNSFVKRFKEESEVKNKDNVHFVELSDAAKKDIKEKGQPMFAGLGAIAGADYMQGQDEQNKTGIFKDLMKAKKH